nr:agamous-like MADS-box protein AGL11 [Ipomoea batatas]
MCACCEGQFGKVEKAETLCCSCIKGTIDRYKKATSDASNICTPQELNAQFYQQESKKLRQQIHMLQNSNRHLVGEGLGSLNHDLIIAETENLQKREVQLEQENAFLRAKIAENERLQQLSMMPAGQDYHAIQHYLARNMLQLNVMESVQASYSVPDKKTLHLD